MCNQQDRAKLYAVVASMAILITLLEGSVCQHGNRAMSQLGNKI